ncbi:MAG TPA: DUF3467 domain-containing protein [Pyrinomonadaceae bacterium]|nr:DUF3467 domain-containing protein [Pyrinomonadaceae bacterium]
MKTPTKACGRILALGSLTVDQNKTTQDRLPSNYSNHLQVGYNAFEFLLEFAQFRENDTDVVNVTAIVTSPAFAKAFSRTLSDTIASYEQRFGEIPDLDR